MFEFLLLYDYSSFGGANNRIAANDELLAKYLIRKIWSVGLWNI